MSGILTPDSGECHVCGLISGNRNVSVTVKNTLGAKVGDRVELESSTISILSYAAAVLTVQRTLIL